MNGLDAEEWKAFNNLQKIKERWKIYYDEFQRTYGDFIAPNLNRVMTQQEIEEITSNYVEYFEKFFQWMKEKHPEVVERDSKEITELLRQFEK